MKRPILFLVATLAMLPLLAFAHTHLEKSTPAANSIGAAPEHVVLEFAEAVKMTSLTVQKEGDKDARKLGPLPAKPAAIIQVESPQLAAGIYALKWRAVGDDGHVMSGTVRFTVTSK